MLRGPFNKARGEHGEMPPSESGDDRIAVMDGPPNTRIHGVYVHPSNVAGHALLLTHTCLPLAEQERRESWPANRDDGR